MDEKPGASRREALGILGAVPLMAAAATASTATTVRAQTASRPPVEPDARVPPLTLVSRHIQFAEPNKGIEIAKTAGFGGIAWTIRGGAHIEVPNAKRDLKPIVDATRAAGLLTPMIITQVNGSSPENEALLGAMRESGIRRYRLGTQGYDLTKEIQPQFDAVRRRMDEIAKMNERHDALAMFHTHSGGAIGGAGWDMWMLVKDYDPRYIGINYDIGHTTVKGGKSVPEQMRAMHKHIHAMSVKDFHWIKRPNAAPNTWAWTNEFVPPGEGMVNFWDAFTYLKSINWTGPLEQYFEYTVPIPGTDRKMNMLGTNYKQWQLEIPENQFSAYLKRDVDFYKDVMRKCGYV